MLRVMTASAIGLLAATALASAAHAVPVTFTKLTGITGGTIAGTAVYRADLSGVGLTDIESLSITDASGGFGGDVGEFSGFDLDAVVISTVLITDASAVGTLTPAATLDFGATVFSPGTQRAPVDPKLFGTDAAGTALDNLVATLGAFDGESSTATPDGFLSMGDFGSIGINLVASIPVSSPLYLYIGEVGDNGEVAGSNIEVSDTPVTVPEPAGLGLLAAGLASILALARRRREP